MRSDKKSPRAAVAATPEPAGYGDFLHEIKSQIRRLFNEYWDRPKLQSLIREIRCTSDPGCKGRPAKLVGMWVAYEA
jgi:hypothetical protein